MFADARGQGQADGCLQVEELAKAKLEAPKTLRQLAGWEWSEIDEGCLCFDRRQQEAAAVRQTSLPVLQAFLKVLSVPACFVTQRHFVQVYSYIFIAVAAADIMHMHPAAHLQNVRHQLSGQA